MNIGREIRRRRTNAGMTQSDLAKAVGISQSAVVQIERGYKMPSIATLERICEVLGATASVIMIDAVESGQEAKA